VLTKAVTGLSDVMGSLSYDVYPNPASDVLNVKLDLKQAADLSIALYTLDGKLAGQLYNGTEAAGSVSRQFSLGQYSKGVYLLQITTGSESSMQKLMIN
jgi:hypothetical protein